MNDDILFTPRSGEEMMKAVPGARLIMYSNLCRMVKQQGIARVIGRLLKESDKYIVLLQHPKNSKTGHWLGLKILPKSKEIYFFNSYSGMPDAKKHEWLSEEHLLASGQDIDVFNDGLKYMAEQGWKIHYNDRPYQIEGDKTATCGIWTAGFLNSELDPDQFYFFNNFYRLTPQDYYFAYFTKKD